MIVIDSSALIAILRREPEADSFLQIVAEADACLLSSVSLLEASMILAGRTGSTASWVDLDALITDVLTDCASDHSSLRAATHTDQHSICCGQDLHSLECGESSPALGQPSRRLT